MQFETTTVYDRHMNSAEKTLWYRIQKACNEGSSLLLVEEEKEIATKFVKQEKCFWSIDYDHVMPYSIDYTILMTGID